MDAEDLLRVYFARCFFYPHFDSMLISVGGFVGVQKKGFDLVEHWPAGVPSEHLNGSKGVGDAVGVGVAGIAVNVAEGEAVAAIVGIGVIVCVVSV